MERKDAATKALILQCFAIVSLAAPVVTRVEEAQENAFSPVALVKKKPFHLPPTHMLNHPQYTATSKKAA